MDLQPTDSNGRTTVVEKSVVFISYSHDSTAHKERVRSLHKVLKDHGVDCKFDQTITNPPEGWPQWMVNRLEEADYVLIICTETYSRRFSRREKPGTGKGGTWEGAIVTQALYDDSAINTKYVPVLFDESDGEHIPTVLKGATRYRFPDDLRNLYGYLTRQSLVEEVPLGEIFVIQPERAPNTDWLTAKLKSPTAIRFGSEDLRNVILAFHDVIKHSNTSSDSKEDFFVVELEEKNRLNGMGESYSQLILDHHEMYFGRINSFLESPVNVEVKEKYFEVVDELRAKIAVVRPRSENFEQILQAFVDGAANQSSGTLKMKRSVLNILISFMYVNCDIGQKS